MGIGETSVYRLIKRGLPSNENGWIKIGDADFWFARHGLMRPGNPVCKSGYEHQTAFATRIGSIGRTVKRYIALGMPIENGLIHIDTALAWVNANVSPAMQRRNQLPKKRVGKPELIKPNQLATLAGVSKTTIMKWTNQGMPFDAEAVLFDPDDALKWIKDNKSNKIEYLNKNKVPPDGCVSRKEFCDRLGISQCGYLIRLGLPTDGRFIPLEAALIWFENYKSKTGKAA